MIFESYSAEDTKKIGQDIGIASQPGEVYCLTGDLGCGKTVFAKGFAKGLLIPEDIVSPTFTIINEYESGRLPFYHFDAYRITNISQMDDIGYEDYFYQNGICLVEWAECIKAIIPKGARWIRIEKDYNKNDEYRSIILL